MQVPCIALGLSLCLWLMGCGDWRLRGADMDAALAARSIAITGANSETYNLIQQQLIRRHVLTDAVVAAYQLKLGVENWQRRDRVSRSSAATTGEYELVLTLRYAILDSNQRTLRPSTEARVMRSYRFDDNDIAGQDKEEQIIRRDMRRAIAQQILAQLQYFQRQSP